MNRKDIKEVAESYANDVCKENNGVQRHSFPV